MNMPYVPVLEAVQFEHSDRVAWYQKVIYEWTGQIPHVCVQVDGQVSASVTAYHSQAGVLHAAPTQVGAGTSEHALEQLATQLYADLQADLVLLVQGTFCSAPGTLFYHL